MYVLMVWYGRISKAKGSSSGYNKTMLLDFRESGTILEYTVYFVDSNEVVLPGGWQRTPIWYMEDQYEYILNL
jgi:hypothetical protein